MKYVPALWADLDAKDFGGSKAEARHQLEAFLFPPTIVIDSGNGLHAYWVLKEPEMVSDVRAIAKLEAQLHGLSRAVGGDRNACDLGRLLRLPGTQNVKNPAKSLPVQIVSLHPERQYNLSDFEFLVREEDRAGSAGYQAFRDGPIPEGKRNVTLMSLAGYLRRVGLDLATIEATLHVVNQQRCQPSLTKEEISEIVRSVGRYSPGFDSDTPISNSVPESKWVSAKKLLEEPDAPIPWSWPGYLASGLITLLSARPKTGKTTLLFHLLRALLQNRPFLGANIHQPGTILLLTEEGPCLLRRRLERLNLGHDDLWILRRTQLNGWSDALRAIRAAVEQGARLIIIDTLATFWGLAEENDAGVIHNTLVALQRLAQEHGVALLLIHHLRKTEGEDGTAHRGSGAIVAVADIAIEMRRVAHYPSRRSLHALSRFEETPQEVIIELQDQEYVFLGESEQVTQADTRTQVLAALPDSGEEAVTREELQKRLDPQPSDTLLKEVLRGLEGSGAIEKRGAGKKGDPFRYRQKPVNSASNPSGCTIPPK